MLRADVVVVELESLAKGKFKDLFGPRSERLRSGGKASNRPDLLLHLPAHRFQGHPAVLQGLGGEAIALVHEAEQDVLGTDETMVEEPCFYLCQHEDAPGSVGEALKHGPSLPGLRRPAAVSCSRLLVEQARHDIDDEADDHGTEQIRDQRVSQGGTSHGLRGQIGVGYLERHADGKGEVGEVDIVRS